ncbi:tRNA pseudouridine(38-40) synthase TruA [Pseudoclavibacter sp. AY1F1]|uniref:tRNA pseudouridine synthase A n=1 Tax=Pseudoclavibacter sp. AY1F1 TaxID=2080583 RepID=UPI000CE8F360|nr:tRNA pseudouridine synthase A [Pseudoclavibacter sp. AY1F1]PPF43852.1 tRNA pseudouridine(38-40) synthase TruA [Pseudoclavibacter sp. AY1F1]
MGHGQGTTRFRLDIAYDGTAFSGWAAQPELRTVQGALEDAIRLVARDLPPGPLLTVAGRTDAGVHATAQVAHLDLDDLAIDNVRRRSDDDVADILLRRTNGVLGRDSDVVVSRVALAPTGFDARFSAVSRSYEFRIADRLTRPNPIERHRTAVVTRSLDPALMQAAADKLIGLHDFAGFCRPRPHSTTIRTLQRFDWTRDEHGVLVAKLEADAFCHSMVRSLVGMCAEAGAGRIRLADVPALLHATERSGAFPVLSARGLTLTGVGYPADNDLLGRQQITRAQRPTLHLVEPLASPAAVEAGSTSLD